MGKILGKRGLRKRFVSSLLATRHPSGPKEPEVVPEKPSLWVSISTGSQGKTLQRQCFLHSEKPVSGFRTYAPACHADAHWQSKPRQIGVDCR